MFIGCRARKNAEAISFFAFGATDKAAREVMRKQTNKANFSVEDISLQAADQEEITGSDITELREEYDLKKEEERKVQKELNKKSLQKEQRKVERKASRKKN